MNERKAILCLIFVAFVWGGGFLATDLALDSFPPFLTMAVRFLFSSLILGLCCYRRISKLKKKEWKQGMICGICLFLAFAFQTLGLQSTTPGKNAFLTAANVVFLPYVVWLFTKKKPTVMQIGSSLLCIAGVGFLTLQDAQSGITIGDGLSLLCALFFALHMFALERYQSIDSVSLTFVQFFVAGILSLGGTILFDEHKMEVTGTALASMAFLILCSTLLAYLIQTKAQQYTKATTTSLILSNESVFAILLSAIVLKEQVSITMMIGICLILFAVQISIKTSATIKAKEY